MNEVVTFLDLLYDREKLIEESNMVQFEPFGKSNLPSDNQYIQMETWQIGRVENASPEVDRIVQVLKEILGTSDIRPRFYKQEANTVVPIHKDINTLCSVNIMLTHSYIPVLFENFGYKYYGYNNCVLLNVQERHMVEAYPIERHFLKFSIFDITYQQAQKSYENKRN